MTAEPTQSQTCGYKEKAGPMLVDDVMREWTDASRDRTIPVRILFPQNATEKCPVVIFSPGLGASRDYYLYLGRHWASYGYVAVHITHPGTDESLWRNVDRPWQGMSEALDDARHWTDRPRDVSLLLDQLPKDDELGRCCDMERVVVAGHSYGAFTALSLVGLYFDLPDRKDVQMIDERVSAVIAMSPQGPGMFGMTEDAWRDIAKPVMSMTGTRDRGRTTKDYKERLIPHERIRGDHQYQVVIKRANHYAFSDGDGIGLRPQPRDPAHHGFIQMATIAFLDAYMNNSRQAWDWLNSGGLQTRTDGACDVWCERTQPFG